MASQVDLLITVENPNGKPWYGSTARHFLAALDEQYADRQSGRLPPAFFCYDEQGKPLQTAMPYVRFGFGKRVLRITGIGEVGVALVEENAISVLDLVSRHFQRPLPVRLEYTRVGLRTGEKMFSYAVHGMAVTLDAKRYKRFMALDEDGKRRFLTEKILSGLQRQCKHLDIDWSSIDFSLGDLTKPLPVRIKKESTKSFALVYPRILFYSNAQFDGSWSVGHLTSRGHGVIRRHYAISAELDQRIRLAEVSNG